MQKYRLKYTANIGWNTQQTQSERMHTNREKVLNWFSDCDNDNGLETYLHHFSVVDKHVYHVCFILHNTLSIVLIKIIFCEIVIHLLWIVQTDHHHKKKEVEIWQNGQKSKVQTNICIKESEYCFHVNY